MGLYFIRLSYANNWNQTHNYPPTFVIKSLICYNKRRLGIDIYTVQPGSLGVHVTAGATVENEISNMSYEEIQALKISEFREIMLRTKGYALDKDILACNMNLYYIFIFVAAVIVAAEFSGSTIKNTLSSVINRNRYFLSKVVFASLCCLGFFFLNTYIMYFANILFNNKALASGSGVVTKITLLQLPPILALASILTGLAFILKKTAVFNTIAIPLMMVIQLLLNLMGIFLKIKEEWMAYELQQMLVLLTGDPSGSYILHSYLVCAVIIVVFYSIGYLSFKKAEIR